MKKYEKKEYIYSDFEYYETELVNIEYSSTMRGIKIAQLTVSPFSYDIESNVLRPSLISCFNRLMICDFGLRI